MAMAGTPSSSPADPHNHGSVPNASHMHDRHTAWYTGVRFRSSGYAEQVHVPATTATHRNTPPRYAHSTDPPKLVTYTTMAGAAAPWVGLLQIRAGLLHRLDAWEERGGEHLQ